MKKYIFLISILTTFLNAYSIYNGRCVTEAFWDNLENKYKVKYVHSELYNSVSSSVFEIITNNAGKAYFHDNRCYVKVSNSTNNFLGLSDELFNFLSGLTGLLTGFLLSFIILKRV